MINPRTDYLVILDRENSDAFSERVRKLVREAGSASMLARTCGLSDSVVRKWIKGESDPSRLMLIKLGLGTGVNFDWLVLGEGPQYGGSVREESAAYGVQDRDSYLVALQLLEEVLQDANVELTPSKKVQAVEIIASMIEKEQGDVSKSNIVKLVTLAS